MNNVTFQLTDEDLLLWSREQAQIFLKPGDAIRKGRLKFALIWGLLFCLIAGLLAGSTAALLLAGAALLSLLFAYVAMPFALRQDAQQRTWAAFGSRVERQPVTVSLGVRGVLEADDCEERLTLYDAIETAELTETFLFAKDKRGGILLIPIRAFGSESEAQTFLIELQNRRMQSAVGLRAATPVPIETPTLPPVAAPRVVAQPWWKSQPAGAENESVVVQQSGKTGN